MRVVNLSRPKDGVIADNYSFSMDGVEYLVCKDIIIAARNNDKVVLDKKNWEQGSHFLSAFLGETYDIINQKVRNGIYELKALQKNS